MQTGDRCFSGVWGALASWNMEDSFSQCFWGTSRVPEAAPGMGHSRALCDPALEREGKASAAGSEQERGRWGRGR